MINHALYFTGPHQVEILEEPMPVPNQNEVLVKNKWSAISAGTEMLFFQDLNPEDIKLDESIASLNHKVKYPFKYGYSSVGQIIEVGNPRLKHLINRWIFAFNPHQTYFCINQNQVIYLPDEVSPKQALFIPSMETAINLILDGSPLIGEKVIVLGLGIIGLLTASLLQKFPLSSLMGCDLHAKRRQLCLELGADLVFSTAENLKKDVDDVDLIYELTGNPEALNTAINYAGYEGRIVLGSWYGKKSCDINLGGKFHRNRIKIISSQVSTLASKFKGRWNKTRRLELVCDILKKIDFVRLISHEFPLLKAKEAYQLLLNKPEHCLLMSLSYENP